MTPHERAVCKLQDQGIIKRESMKSESQMDFEAGLEMSSYESVALLGLAKLLVLLGNGDGEAGALALELRRRAKEI